MTPPQACCTMAPATSRCDLNKAIVPEGGPDGSGLKREAGEKPARSRHCNWQEPLYSSLRMPLARNAGPGRQRGSSVARSQETCLWVFDWIRFAERCTGLLTFQPDREGRAFLFPARSRRAAGRSNRPAASPIVCPYTAPQDVPWGKTGCRLPGGQDLLPSPPAAHPVLPFPQQAYCQNAKRQIALVALSASKGHNGEQPDRLGGTECYANSLKNASRVFTR